MRYYPIITKREWDLMPVIFFKKSFNFVDIGIKEISFYKGNTYSVLFEDVFLSLVNHNQEEMEGYTFTLGDSQTFYIGVP